MNSKNLILIIQFSFLILSICQYCTISNNRLTNTACFNNIKLFDFDNRYYRAGHFAINEQGDLIIEYSDKELRLFYGLKKNGELFFPNETKEIAIEDDSGIDPEMIRRYESINSFVSLKNDTNKEKEYLISLSSWKTILELYDLNSDDYKIMTTVNFTNKEKGIFSFVFQILEAKINNQIIYFCIYIYSNYLYHAGIDGYTDFGNNFVIKKIAFKSFDFNSLEIIDEITEENNNNRITSGIIVDKYELLLVFSVKYESSYNQYCLYYYNYALVSKGQKFLDRITRYSPGYGLYFKAYYLYDDYIAFLAFIDYDYNKYIFRILNINQESQNYNIEYGLYFYDNRYPINYDISLNDFVKIDNERLALVSTDTSNNKLYFIFFDLYSNYREMKVRYYFFDFTNDKISKIIKELSAFVYNGYLIFTATVTPSTSSYTDDVFPVLILFGYANGTDNEINISPYLIDCDDYIASYNLVYDLVENLTIENNLFNYEKEPKIKLISIPQEIFFYYSSNNSLVSDGDIIDTHYILKQNSDITKENKYYFLEYQYIIRESDYNLFYSNAFYSTDVDVSSELMSLFEPRIFYGRINTLKFKLCNLYCRTCIKLGVNELNQECESCLDDYKYYINETTNKKICIDINSACPENFTYYNELTKECLSHPIPETSTIFHFETSSPIESSLISTTKNINTFNTIKETTNINIDLNINICSIQELILTSCSKLNFTNEQINNKINNDLIPHYSDPNQNSSFIIIKGENNSLFEITTTDYEQKRFSGYGLNPDGLSIVILGNCENLLKITYGIDKNLSLIIKKYEQITISAERNVQYEVYDPVTKKKLNLSICDQEQISLYVPIELNEELLKLYNDLQNYGYDLFNINDPFYNDLCTPYKSVNGTDVILLDRKNDFYNNNFTTCQSNCHYSSFNPGYKLLKCECKVIVDDIDVNDIHKFSQKIYKNFYDVLKNSNYKVMKCYKLVFNWKYLRKNIGNFIVLTFFAFYLGFFIIYLIQGIAPLQKEAKKSIFINKEIKDDNKEKEKKFPPKKKKSILIGNKSISVKKRKSKRKSAIPFNNKGEKVELEKANNINKKIKKSKTKLNVLENSVSKNELNIKAKLEEENKTDIEKSINKLDDLDLNNLTYDKAIELDKRTLFQIYWSRLKNKHLIIYTFISCHDYNLIYIKISRFIFLVVTSMALNVLFFFDVSMHKIYLDYGKYSFIQQIPQILYSSLVSLIIEILIGFLSYTDINIYEIRQIREVTAEKVNEVLKKIKIKLIVFFGVTFLFFLFYWYLISCFCAVYNNTQIIYIKDFVSSFSIGLLYPFLIQMGFALVRIFSLKEKSKIRSLLYKMC